MGDPIEERYKEHMDRGLVISQLSYCITSYRDAAMSNDPKFDHIDMAEKQKVCFLLIFFFSKHLYAYPIEKKMMISLP